MKLGSQLTYSTTSHPRTNGRSEVVSESRPQSVALLSWCTSLIHGIW